MAKDVVIKVHVKGIADCEQRLKRFEQQFRTDLTMRLFRYSKIQLVRRIRERLRNSTEARTKTRGKDGITMPKGGYNAKPNSERYAEWKKQMANLPSVGGVETTTMIATGHLRQSIAHKFKSTGGHYISLEVGPIDANRPTTTPFKEASPGSADTSRVVSNEEVAAAMEEKYKFMTQEAEDVRRDMPALLLFTITRTLKRIFKK